MNGYPAIIVLASSVALASCGDAARRGSTGDREQAGGAGVTVPMRDAAGKELGTLTLAEDSTISISGKLGGLPPGEHAIHLHTTGRCEPPRFESAGNHWNPTNRQHGLQNPQGPHLGDLPNFTVSQDGSGSIQATTPGGTLRGTNAVLDGDGAAVVVHAKPDDYKSQPSGNSGDRIACGLVGGGAR